MWTIFKRIFDNSFDHGRLWKSMKIGERTWMCVENYERERELDVSPSVKHEEIF